MKKETTKQDHPEKKLVPVGPTGPVDYIRKAEDVAEICKKFVKASSMDIKGKKYVKVEGWQSIATAHGCVAGSRDVEVTDTGWKAVGEIRRISDGILIAQAEGFVGKDEKKWASGNEYAARAMAQTRAISRVCRSAFAHVLLMIDPNLQTIPLEEIPYEEEPTHRETRSGKNYPLKKPENEARISGIASLRHFIESEKIPEAFLMKLCHETRMADGSEEKIDDLKDGVIERLNTQKARDRMIERWKENHETNQQTESRKGETVAPVPEQPSLPTPWNRAPLIPSAPSPESVLKVAQIDSWKDVIVNRGKNKDIALGDLTQAQLSNIIRTWKPVQDAEGGYPDEEILMDSALTLAAQE